MRKVLLKAGIPATHHDRIINYIGNVNLIETDMRKHMSYNPTHAPQSIQFNSGIPHSIKILSRIKDLTKIIFMNAPSQIFGDRPIQVENFQYRADLNGYYDVLRHSCDVSDALVNNLINGVVSYINERIDDGYIIYVYNLCSRIFTMNDISAIPSIHIDSRFTCIKEVEEVEEVKEITINDL